MCIVWQTNKQETAAVSVRRVPRGEGVKQIAPGAPLTYFNDGGVVSYFIPQKITTSEFVYPKKSLLFLVPSTTGSRPFAVTALWKKVLIIIETRHRLGLRNFFSLLFNSISAGYKPQLSQSPWLLSYHVPANSRRLEESFNTLSYSFTKKAKIEYEALLATQRNQQRPTFRINTLFPFLHNCRTTALATCCKNAA